ncbi:MAG: hypothetical protein ABR585_07055 [Gemmatimonadaceae bacterium]
MLTWPYLHLLLNHFPVVLSVSALVVTLLALVLKRKGLWLTAMGALTAAGVFIYPVHFTGDKADRALHDPWFVRHGAIEAHDDAARIAMIVILLVGVFAAYSWWRALKKPADVLPVWMRGGVLIGALAAVGTVTYTAYLGGKIIHESPVLELQRPPEGFSPAIAADSVESPKH